MEHATSMRALSLGASAALLGFAVIGAFTMKVGVMRAPPILEGDIFDAYREPPPPEPPEPVRTPQPRGEPVDFSPFTAPMAPIALDGPSAPTDLLPAAYGGPAEITDPHWLRRPSDLSRYYPRRALERGVEGQAVLNCLVSATGALACSVSSETPLGWGFGEAALRISRDHQMTPASRGGENVVGSYRMIVPFALQGG